MSDTESEVKIIDYSFDKSTIFDEDDISEQPLGIVNIDLYLHQKLCLQKMKKLEEQNIIYNENDPRVVKEENITSLHTDFGFLADIPGYGKSLTMLSLILSNPNLSFKEKQENIQIGNGFRYTYSSNKEKKQKLLTNLFIVPFITISQWKEYIERYTDLSFKIIKTKKDFENYKTYFNEFECIIVTDTMYENFDAGYISSIVLSRLILDEADSITIKSATKIGLPDAVFTWFISGTIGNLFDISVKGLNYYDRKKIPMLIKRTLCEFPFSIETIKNTVIVKNSLEFINKTMSIPIIDEKIIVSKDPNLITVIKGLVSEDILKMINAGNEEEAIKILKIETSTETNLSKILTEKLLEELDNLNKQYFYIESTKGDRKKKEEQLKKIQQNIDEYKEKIQILKERLSSKLNEQECQICMEDFSSTRTKIMMKCCNSITCSKCIVIQLSEKNTCFLCTTPINESDIFSIQENAIENAIEINNEYSINNDKDENLEILLKKLEFKNQVLKIIIFADNNSCYNIISNKVRSLNIPIFDAKGRIDSKIENFKNAKQTQILFLNSNFCGEGINLTFCTDIIFWHKMDKNKEQQVIGRGQRLGREQQLRVWKIFNENENM